MKTVILFRHAHPEIGGFILDHDRPLASDGISDAEKIGLYVTEKNELPDLVISSTAIRAKTTAEMAMSRGKWPCSIKFDAGIYERGLHYLLKLINNQDNSLSSICLVGHEPNFSNFIAQSTGNICKHFTQGSMAKIDFNVKNWEDLTMGYGMLSWRVDPREV